MSQYVKQVEKLNYFFKVELYRKVRHVWVNFAVAT